MSAAIVVDPVFIIEKGTTVSKTFTLVAGSNPVNLTGCAVTAHLRSGSPDNPGSIILNCSTAGTRLTFSGSDPTLGIVLWQLSVADTATLAAGDYFQEVWVTYSNSTKKRWLVMYWQVQNVGGDS